MNKQAFKYKAFISYSHSADNKLAYAIQNALHKFAKPWYKIRQLNVFRDQTNLSVSPELWPNIQQAISLSEYFLLFASRDSAKSKWVKREINWWVDNRPVNHLFIILTDGAIEWNEEKSDFEWNQTNALPATLSGKFKFEPNYIDFRQFKTTANLNLRDPLFLENILSIAAPLHGKNKEELGGEDVRQHRITKLISWSAGLIIGLASIVAIWQAIVANQQRKAAVTQGSISLARQLAAQSELIRINDFKNLPLSVSLAVEALNIFPAAEIDHAAWAGIVLLPKLCNETGNWGVSQIKFSPDGKYFATAGQDSTARVIERKSNKTIFEFRNAGKIWDIDFSKDGNMIATAGDDGVISLINLKTDSIIKRFKHSAAVRKILFSSDDKYLASASEDNTACIWDIRKNQKKAIIRHTSKVWALAFSHDNTYIVTASRDSTAILWDIKTNKKKFQLKHNDILWNVSFSPGDKYILTTSDDKSARIWNTSNGVNIKKLEHSGRVMAAAFSPDGNTLITTSWDKTIKIWSAHDFKELSTINTGGIILSLAYSPDSRYFVAGGKYTSVWDAATYREVNRLYQEQDVYNTCFDPEGQYFATADAQKGRVWKVTDNSRKVIETNDRIAGGGVPVITRGWSAVMASDSNYLLTGNEDGIARLWDLDTKSVISTFKHGRPIKTVAYSSSGNRIASASDSLIKIWDATTAKLLLQYPYKKEVISLGFDESGNYLAIGGDQGLVILETVYGKPVFTQSTIDPVYFTAFSKLSQSLLFIEAGGKLSLVNVREKKVYFTKQYRNLMRASISLDKNYICLATESQVIRLDVINAKPDEISIPVEKGYDATESPDNRFVAVCTSQDSTTLLYDLGTKKKVAAFRHNSAVVTASFDKTGKYLATACHDGSVHIRDLETKTEVSSINWNFDDPIERVDFSPGSKYIIAASEQYKTSAWLWRASDATNLACSLLKYRLTESDWSLFMNGRKYQPICR